MDIKDTPKFGEKFTTKTDPIPFISRYIEFKQQRRITDRKAYIQWRYEILDQTMRNKFEPYKFYYNSFPGILQWILQKWVKNNTKILATFGIMLNFKCYENETPDSIADRFNNMYNTMLNYVRINNTYGIPVEPPRNSEIFGRFIENLPLNIKQEVVKYEPKNLENILHALKDIHQKFNKVSLYTKPIMIAKNVKFNRNSINTPYLPLHQRPTKPPLRRNINVEHHIIEHHIIEHHNDQNIEYHNDEIHHKDINLIPRKLYSLEIDKKYNQKDRINTK